MVERRGQDRGRVAVQRVQPDPLEVAVMVVGAGAAAVAEGGADRAEVRSRVARAGVPRGVGERLHHQHPVPVHREVVIAEAAQHPRQHRGGQVQPPARRQHAQPLVVGDMDQPRVLLLPAPAQELVPGRAAQRRGSEPGQRDPLPVQLGDIAQHLPGQPMPEPMMGIQARVEPAGLLKTRSAAPSHPRHDHAPASTYHIPPPEHQSCRSAPAQQHDHLLCRTPAVSRESESS